MDKLEALLNFTNSEGEVVTLFGGRVTLSQLVVIVLALIAVFLVLKFIKGVVKFIVMGVIICYSLVHFGIASPQQLKDVSSQIIDKGIGFYETFVEASSNIKYEDDKLMICTDGDVWLNVSEIKSFVTGKEGVVTIKTSDGSYTVSDSEVIKLLETFK